MLHATDLVAYRCTVNTGMGFIFDVHYAEIRAEFWAGR